MHRYITTMLLGAALCAPVAMRAADDEHHDRDRNRRVYDRENRDYHEWNEREDRAYRHWLEENRRPYMDYNRVDRRQQQEYWRWRHKHHDDDDRR